MSRRLTDTQAFLLVCSVVFLSRLPFVHSTLGTDADVFRVALTALRLAGEGTYEPSRFPGFPVQEFVFALLLGTPAVVLNLLTAGLSGVSAGFFTLVLRRARLGNSILLGFVLAATPVVFVHSTNAADYLWALAGIIGGLWALPRTPWLAGILLGLAVGCRFTSLLMVPPFIFLLWKGSPDSRSRVLFQFAGALTGAVGLLFLPAVLSITPVPASYPPVATDALTTVYKATAGVWGVPGALAIAAVAAAVLIPVRRRSPEIAGFLPGATRDVVTASWLAIALFVLVFLLYPYESGYLIPLIPWVLLLLGLRVRRFQVVILLALLLLSSFTFGIVSTGQPEVLESSRVHVVVGGGARAVVLDVLKGPVWLERERRDARSRLLRSLMSYADTATHRTVVVAGWLIPQLRYELGGKAERGEVRFVYALRERALTFYRENNYRLFYLRGMEVMNMRRNGVDLAAGGAELLVFD